MSEPTDREILLDMRGDIKDIRRQTTLTNGRVTRLEEKELARELREAEERGKASERGKAVVTKAQLAALGSIVGVVGTAAGFLSRYLG